MARTKFTMPSNFSGFPSCTCGCKNFTKKKFGSESELWYECDDCKLIRIGETLGITSETAEPEKHIHQHIKDWNTSTQRNKVAETVADMESRGDKVFRVRKPWEL